jgi:glycosyltransferase involved in cell wall biosynthesis
MLSVLSAHNYYQQPGGEDRGFIYEAALLEAHGNTVVRYSDHNHRIGKAQLGVVCGTVWSVPSYRQLGAVARSYRFDVAHFHNTFPLISPSGYYAVRGARIPIVQTLQNYRLLCPGATLTREGTICEDCIDRRSLVPAVRHGCYRESRAATAAVSAMLLTHRALGTWQVAVDAYIAVSEFGRRKFIKGGLPPERIFVKPNFIPSDAGPGDGAGDYALFVGRLAEEKGIRALAQAWAALSDLRLIVAGDGPLLSTPWPENVTALGSQNQEQVLSLMRNARMLVFPSIWYECAPMVIVEALACGLPVIASDLGSIPEFVRDHYNGLLFRPGDADDLAAKVRWAFEHPHELAAMRVAARREFEDKYTADRNYKILMNIYELAIENSRRRQRAAS